MKNFNFFEKLWEHSRTLRRVGLVLVMCLISITQAWGYNCDLASVYYDNSVTQWTYVQLLYEHSGGSAGWNMQHITHTKLYYCAPGYWNSNNFSGLRFADGTNSDWGWAANQSSWDRTGKNNSKKCTAFFAGDIANNHHLFTCNTNGYGSNIGHPYYGTDPTILNKDVTVGVKTKVGNNAYSSSVASVATISMQHYTFNSETENAVDDHYTESVPTLAKGSTETYMIYPAYTSDVRYSYSNLEPGYEFIGWYDGSGNLLSSDDVYTPNTTADYTIYAYFAQAYAFVEGRFRIYNAARNAYTTTYSSGGNWNNDSRDLQMTFNNTKKCYELYTYMTPAEMTENHGTGCDDCKPYFYIKTSSSSSSLSDVTAYRPASGLTLEAAGSANGKAVASSDVENSLRFNSASTNGYVVLYFDQTKVWYELEYTVTYNANGGSCATSSARQSSPGASLTLPTPTWSGYTFDGWYSDGTKIGNGGASYTPTSDITLYAKWTDNTAGKIFSFIDNNYGDKFKGFTGYGWVAKDSTGRNKTFTNASTEVQYIVSAGCWDNKSNAIAALAKFKKGTTSMSVVIPEGKIATVKISYGAYANDKGTKYGPLTVEGSNKDAVSTALTNEMTNAQVIGAMKEITLSSQKGTLNLGSANGNIFIGRVSAVITGYTITYNPGEYGSGSIDAGTKTHGTNFTLSSSTFSRDGYTQDGWSTSDGGDKAYNLGGTYSTDAAITLYPHWAATSYTLSYDLAGGSVESANPTSYTILSSAITLNNPTKNGYIFAGWTGTDLAEATTTVTIAAGSTGDRSYTATWTCKTPVFGTDLSTTPVEYTVGASAAALTVAASANSGTIAYQWYSNDGNNYDTPTPLTNCTTATYKPSTASEGTTYYFCTATNTTGGCSATTNSQIANIAVSLSTYAITHREASNGSYTIKVGDAEAVSTNTTAAASNTITLAATPSSGYQFAGWKVFKDASGDAVSVSENAFTMPAEAVSVVAFFTYASDLVTLEPNTLYKAENMVASSITSVTGSEQYAAGVSSDSRFEMLGAGTTNENTGKTSTIGIKDNNSDAADATIDGKDFAYSLFFKGPSHVVSNIPLSRAVKFRVPASGKLVVYTKNGKKINYAKSGAAGTAINESGENAKNEIDVTAGVYYIYATDKSTTLFGLQFVPACTDPGLAFAEDSKTTTLCDAAPTNALTNTHSVAVTYTSSDETVATVAADGTLTIKAAGTTTITASSIAQTVSAVDYCADEATYTITVTASTAAGLAYGTSTVKKNVGDDAFTNTLTNSNGLEVSYESSNTSVATVDEDGEVTIKAAGTTTITASSAQQKVSSTCYAAGSATYTLTVYPVYTVTYYAMGGTCSPTSTNTTTALGKVTLPSATHASYTTYSWVTSDGTEAGDAGDTYTPEGNINLYAKWSGSCAGGGGSPTTIVLTDFGKQFSTSGPRYGRAYVGNISGDVHIIESNDAENQKIGDKDSTAIRVDYGSYIKVLGPNATVADYTTDSTFSSVSRVEFRFKMYNANSGGTATTIDVYVGNTKVASAIEVTGEKTDPFKAISPITISPAKNGAVRIVNTGSGTTNKNIYLDSIAITYSGGSSCYTVTYHGNGATSGYVNDPEQYPSGTTVYTAYNSSITGFKKTGYEFNGWNTTAAGDGEKVSYFTITENTTLFAQWKYVIDSNNEDFAGYDAAPTQYQDVLVTNGATLTLTKSTNVHDITVETGSTLNVSTDGGSAITLATNSLSLVGGWGTVGNETKYDMPRVYIDPASKITKTVKTINFDIAVDNRNFYPIAVPFPVAVRDVNYADAYLAYYALYGTSGQYVIKTYDGQFRANNGSITGCWRVMRDGYRHYAESYGEASETLQPGQGYILRALPANASGWSDEYAIIRFPMKNVDDKWTAAGEKGSIVVDEKTVAKNVVAVEAYLKQGDAEDAGDKTPMANRGWNILGVPYMSCYTTATDMGTSAIIKGRFNYETNKWEDGDIRYVTVPTHDFSEYIQANIEDEETPTVLLPGWCFFVQIGTTGNLTFVAADEAASTDLPYRAPKQEQAMPTVKTGIILTGANAKDKTTILVSDKYNAAEYEINADLEKMFGENGYTLATYTLSGETRLAYNAMNNADIMDVIPVGYRAPEEGEYTFSINPRYAESEAFEQVNLIDYEEGVITNLLQSSYSFTTARTQNDARFAINVVKRQDMPTDVENGASGINDANGPRKVLINDKMYILLDGKMYDATGKAVK